jgi:hypothetical protein
VGTGPLAWSSGRLPLHFWMPSVSVLLVTLLPWMSLPDAKLFDVLPVVSNNAVKFHG